MLHAYKLHADCEEDLGRNFLKTVLYELNRCNISLEGNTTILNDSSSSHKESGAVKFSLTCWMLFFHKSKHLHQHLYGMNAAIIAVVVNSATTFISMVYILTCCSVI